MPNLAQLAILQDQIAPAAVASENATGLPAELSAAQCIIESGWLSRSPGNNCFGIKLDSHGAGVQYFISHEYMNGTWQQYPEAFEKYNTLADCFTDHSKLIIAGQSYAAAWAQYQQDHDLDALIVGISQHYATAPSYAASILEEAHSPFLASALKESRLLASKPAPETI